MKSHLFEVKAKKDLESIFQQLNSGRFVRNKGFSDDVNNHLKNTLEEDKKSSTKTIISLSSWNEMKVKKPFLSSGRIKVVISGRGDSYWLVNGKESSIPGEVESNGIRKESEAEYQLTYQIDENNSSILVDFTDDSGYQFGESYIRTSTNQKPQILHPNLNKAHYRIAFFLGFIYTFLSLWDSQLSQSFEQTQWIVLLTLISLFGGMGYLNFIAVDLSFVLLRRHHQYFILIFSFWIILFFSISNPISYITMPIFLILGKILIK